MAVGVGGSLGAVLSSLPPSKGSKKIFGAACVKFFPTYIDRCPEAEVLIIRICTRTLGAMFLVVRAYLHTLNFKVQGTASTKSPKPTGMKHEASPSQ